MNGGAQLHGRLGQTSHASVAPPAAAQRSPGRGSRGLLLKTAVVVPNVLIGLILSVVFLGLLPPVLALAVFCSGTVLSILLAAGIGESAAVRILYQARPLTSDEARRCSAALEMVTAWTTQSSVQISVATDRHPVRTAGPHHIVISQGVIDAHRLGRITDRQLAALLLQGVAELQVGSTRLDLVWRLWSLPWDSLRSAVVSIGRRLGWVPLVSFAWNVRLVVGTLAVVLEAQAGRWPSSITIAVVLALTYLMPLASRAWEQHLKRESELWAAAQQRSVPSVAVQRPRPLPAPTSGEAPIRASHSCAGSASPWRCRTLGAPPLSCRSAGARWEWPPGGEGRRSRGC